MPSPPPPSALLQQLDELPGETCVIVDEAGEHSVAELRRRTARAAARLHGPEGEPAGRRVALLVRPGAEWVASFLGVLRAGHIAVPLSPAYPRAEIEWLLADAGADRLVVSADRPEPMGPPELEVIRTDQLMAAGSADGLDEEQRRQKTPPAAPTAGEVAMLLYTSGTTGKPKGVMLTHHNLAVQAEALGRAWALSPEDRLLHALPLHHMHGVAISLLPCLRAGAAIQMLPRFEAERVWEGLGRATVFMGVPTMYFRLLEAFDRADADRRERWAQAARGLRLAVSGSAALPATLAERWRDIAGSIPLERFGMSELGVGISNSLAPEDRAVGKVGRPLDVVELRLVDEDGRDTASGPGEIWLRGPGVFTGYWRRPQATESAFCEGWFKTGDTAQRDDRGLIQILGRTSVDIIKSGGVKLSAIEIEEVLRQHWAVADAVVLGIADAEWGQRVVAVVIPRPGLAAQCAEPALRTWAKTKLAPYKVPREIHLRDGVPRNAVGKVVKPALAAELGARASGKPQSS